VQIHFLGAAQSVTGSMHRVRTERASVLLECGLFQGRRNEAFERNRHLPLSARELDAVVLSHAHIDHSGALPSLVKAGYRGPIYATPATRDLCAVMLEDAALIQEADARHVNRMIEREGSHMEPVEPLYGLDEVTQTLSQFVTVGYHRTQLVAPGFAVTFHDAGHVLGSALVALDVDDEGDQKRLLFSGDLGRRNMPILRDPELPSGAHVLLLESTYGDRQHAPYAEMEDRLADVVSRTLRRGGKVLIPSFALERAQEIVYALARLKRAGRLPAIPVYVDSPLTVKITDVFRMHPECYDSDARGILTSGASPFEFDGLRYVSDKEDSKLIDATPDPCVVISASGMCEAGRILHHLKAAVGNTANTVVIVGFQAQHTLGRRLVERRSSVRIFGIDHALRAEVVVLNGFSAHADRDELLAFAEAVRERGPLRQVALVHGEEPAQRSLAGALSERGFPKVAVPARGDVLEV
jgi:metallo-beta-lactamase family protein